MAYVNTVIKDFADYAFPKPVVVAPKIKAVKQVEPDADTEKFIKFLEREERNFDRLLNRIIRKMEEEVQRVKCAS